MHSISSTFQYILRTNLDKHSHEHTPTISICDSDISNLRFADDIDLIAESNKEFQVLKTRLTESRLAKTHRMEINHKKSKTMIKSKT